ncbi:MAG: hypothetical protein PVH03_10060 [Chloroflexota bacterium]|jgi:hypothetical protein
MKLLSFDSPEEIQLARRVARGLSLLSIGFLLLLLVLNEDFRKSPTLPTIVLWILALSTLIAWRWERVGGLLTLFLCPVFLLSLIVQWSGTAELSAPIWQLALIGFGMELPFLIIGWLFITVGRKSQQHESQ